MTTEPQQDHAEDAELEAEASDVVEESSDPLEILKKTYKS